MDTALGTPTALFAYIAGPTNYCTAPYQTGLISTICVVSAVVSIQRI